MIDASNDYRTLVASLRRERGERPAKPSELGLVPPSLPDGSSENFRFVPTPIETLQTGNEAPDSAAPSDSSPPTVPDPLTPRKRLAISALLCGGTLSSAAARVGVSARTLYSWRNEPAFAAELQRRSVEALEANSVRARNLLLKSTQVLAETLHTRDRYGWALKIINARRVWEMAQAMPAAAESLTDVPAPVDAAPPMLQPGPTTTI